MPDVTPEATPGQAAYEAYMARIGLTAYLPGDTWADHADEHAGWDAAAEAANRAGLAKVLAECARYKAERDRTQAAYDELVAEDHWLAGHVKSVLAQADADVHRYRRALEAIRDHNQLGRSVATAAQLAREALEATS